MESSSSLFSLSSLDCKSSVRNSMILEMLNLAFNSFLSRTSVWSSSSWFYLSCYSLLLALNVTFLDRFDTFLLSCARFGELRSGEVRMEEFGGNCVYAVGIAFCRLKVTSDSVIFDRIFTASLIFLRLSSMHETLESSKDDFGLSSKEVEKPWFFCFSEQVSERLNVLSRIGTFETDCP